MIPPLKSRADSSGRDSAWPRSLQPTVNHDYGYYVSVVNEVGVILSLRETRLDIVRAQDYRQTLQSTTVTYYLDPMIVQFEIVYIHGD